MFPRINKYSSFITAICLVKKNCQESWIESNKTLLSFFEEKDDDDGERESYASPTLEWKLFRNSSKSQERLKI